MDSVETILSNMTKNEIMQELLKLGYTQAFMNNKSKEQLAEILAEAESPKEPPILAPQAKKIPKCELY